MAAETADFASMEQVAAEMQQNLTAIDRRIDKLNEDNKRMRSLLSQAALFIACQPENAFRAKWLKEVEELCRG